MDYTVAMQRAIALSEKGLGKCAPNPIVGAMVLDASGKIIGEGFHDRMSSKEHAEVVAIKGAGDLAKGATMVVTLEPCNHTGGTGPCTQVIIDAGISTVVFAVKDPNVVATGGADVLRAAGIKVVDGVLAKEASYANRAWLTKIEKSRPYFVWKVATTLDAKIAASDGTSKWISNEVSRNNVQRLRRESDAILVGTNTVISDDPHLIPRGEFSGYSHNPIRVIFGESDLPTNSKVFDSAAETVHIKSRDLNKLVAKLNELDINQVFVEAGSKLASAMLTAGLLDELVIYQAPALLGSGKPFFADDSHSTIEDQMRLEHISTEVLAGDVKSVYRIGAGV
jgi:diaminohydroxyphosphoribosylaminopyrimidine deaminase / 5-amino-6-(5-phosphoribosylamino)uracil reductase